MVSSTALAWTQTLREHRLYDKNAAAADKVMRSIRLRATTRTERDLARILRNAIFNAWT